MSEDFLHGIEIQEQDIGPRSIGLIDSSVIGLVGTATGIEKNRPILIKGSKDPLLEKLGKAGTIPTALAGIFDQTEAQVVVVNIGEGTADDEAGEDTAGNGGKPKLKGTSNLKTAAESLLNAESVVHKTPRILIAPGFSNKKEAIESLLSVAQRLRSVVIAECPEDENIDSLGIAHNDRLYFIHPSFIVGENKPEPASARIAGVIVRSDNERGFWFSPSNQPIMGIRGTKTPIPFALGDKNAKANELNAKGIATVIHQNGYRLWGNRSYSDNSKWQFLSVRRTADAINDSLLQAHFWAIDRNITKTYVTDVIEGVNVFLRSLKAKGAILGGKCWANPEDNTPDKIQSGQIAFNFDFTPPYPAERITFKSAIVDNYLKELFS
ncbi:hypothetical protein IM40_09570 (plasmid) [Candidatus Paracaedimonas acanthamoebae]|nr:hypothetical protein IM40_09570 [Candidatus Paracaedimonas acanthamoebae]